MKSNVLVEMKQVCIRLYRLFCTWDMLCLPLMTPCASLMTGTWSWIGLSLHLTRSQWLTVAIASTIARTMIARVSFTHNVPEKDLL